MQFHIDGIARRCRRLDVQYLDYSRPESGEWIAERVSAGARIADVIDFLRRTNELVFGESMPAPPRSAEESTAWPMVSRPTYVGGLGFGYKWNLGWMHDTLQLHVDRPDASGRYHHNDHELWPPLRRSRRTFILAAEPHDEVVHGKGSLVGKMPGDRWQRFANLRAYYAFMWTHPGKKLLFMGCEFAQEREWVSTIIRSRLAICSKTRCIAGAQPGRCAISTGSTASCRRCTRLDTEPEGFQWDRRSADAAEQRRLVSAARPRRA